jgi:hypothetical protein
MNTYFEGDGKVVSNTTTNPGFTTYTWSENWFQLARTVIWWKNNLTFISTNYYSRNFDSKEHLPYMSICSFFSFSLIKFYYLIMIQE